MLVNFFIFTMNEDTNPAVDPITGLPIENTPAEEVTAEVSGEEVAPTETPTSEGGVAA